MSGDAVCDLLVSAFTNTGNTRNTGMADRRRGSFRGEAGTCRLESGDQLALLDLAGRSGPRAQPSAAGPSPT